MFTADQIVAHLVGDYILQSQWMADQKVRNSFAAAVHAVTYTLPFAFITHAPLALALICGTHFVIDRWRLARFLVWAKKPAVAGRPSMGRPDADRVCRRGPGVAVRVAPDHRRQRAAYPDQWPRDPRCRRRLRVGMWGNRVPHRRPHSQGGDRARRPGLRHPSRPRRMWGRLWDEAVFRPSATP